MIVKPGAPKKSAGYLLFSLLAATAAAGAVARGAGTAVGTTDALFALLFGPPDIPPGQGQNGGDDA